jgi:hypothetical protein
MLIAIVDPLGSPYDGSTPSKRALGGSESAVVFIARELAKIGIQVDVYNRCEEMDAVHVHMMVYATSLLPSTSTPF